MDYVVFTAYFVLSIILFHHHEPWFDEAQNWLSVKYRSIDSIYGGIALDGHPIAWLLLIMPLAKLGLSYKSVFVFHHFVNWVAAYLFYTKSPFQRITRVLVLFSVYIFFDYNVIAKNYVLVFLVLTLLAIVYPNRRKYVFYYLALLCVLINTHVYATVIGLAIVLADAIELAIGSKNRLFVKGEGLKQVLYFSILLLGIGILVGGFIKAEPYNAFTLMPFVSFSFYKSMLFYLGLPFTYGTNILATYILIIPVGILTISILLRNMYALMVWAFSIIGISYLFFIGYPHSGVHVGILFLLFIYVFWISARQSDSIVPFLRKYKDVLHRKLKSLAPALASVSHPQLLLIFTFICLPYLNFWSYQKAAREIRHPFSNAKNVASYIIDQGLDDKKTQIVAYTAHQTLPILPFFSKIDTFDYYAYRRGNYIEWDIQLGMHYDHYVNNMEAYFDNIRQMASQNKEILFVLDQPGDKPHTSIPEDFEILARFDGAIIPGENYVIFRLK